MEEKDNIGYIVGPVLAVILVIGIVATGCWYVYQNFTKIFECRYIMYSVKDEFLNMTRAWDKEIS